MSSQTLTAEPFLSGLYFGECPRWHDGRLWYSDFFDHAVFSVSPDGERRTEVTFEASRPAWAGCPTAGCSSTPGSTGPSSAGSPTARWCAHGELRPWATWHANDMVVAEQRPGLRRQLRLRPRRPLRRHGRRPAPSRPPR